MARRRFRPFANRRRARHVRQMLPMGLPSPIVASSIPVASGSLRVLGSGEVAFQAIVDRILNAEKSVEIRAFLWRDDEAGNTLATELLDAADRGV